MRFGIATPIVVRVPSHAAEWERGAGVAELGAIAEVADRLGYHHLTCSEHVAVPTTVAGIRGVTYWDPLATFGYIAARTERIRLATNVLVLAYHHPLEIAKRYGTLDLLSGGRLILGLGVGSLVEEFDLLGAPFGDRGARADDALRALRASLAQREPSYSGTHYHFEGMVVEPCAVQERVPMWMGGRTRRSLRRAAALADGWVPFALTLDRAAAMLADTDTPPGFEVVLAPERPLDPVDHPGDVEGALRVLERSGATLVNVTAVHRSLEHYLEQLHAFSELTRLSSNPGRCT